MKTFLTLIAFVFLTGTIQAQDTIFKTNGNLVAAKILEITSTDVKYKKYEFLDGPTYVESKSDIKTIRYSNGLKEDFAPAAPKSTQPQIEVIQQVPAPTETDADYYSQQDIQHGIKMQYNGNYFLYKDRRTGERAAHQILMQTKDREIINLVQESKDAHALKFIGFAAIPLGMGAIYLLSNSINYSGSINSTKLAGSGLCLIGAIACPIVSGIYSKKRRSYNKQAVKLYNERY